MRSGIDTTRRSGWCITLTLVFALLLVQSNSDLTTGDDEIETVITSVKVNLPTSDDKEERGSEWAKEGECEANSGYMLDNCSSSCGQIAGLYKTSPAFILEGDDAAAAAFRYAEKHAGLYKNDIMPTATVLEVAHMMQSKLTDEHSEYVPPRDITHCGKKKCSAGKLWKRAESFRKEDMHDAAGADLIRALMRTGTEVDFKEKCHNLMLWAFGSVRRQREREAREAEAELEKRREEERAAMAEAEERKKVYEANFVKFGESLKNGGEVAETCETTINADGTEEEVCNQHIGSVIDTFTLN